jgi:hypothetical protein
VQWAGVKYQSDDVFGNDFAVEIVRVEGDTDFTRKAGSDCRLVVKGLLEQRAFKARRKIMPEGLVVNANKWRDKATFRGDGQEIVFDSPDETPVHVRLLSEVGNLDYLRVCIEKSVGDAGELIKVAVYLVLRKVDASGRRFRRVGLARTPVGINTIGKKHFTSLNSPARKRAFTPKNIKAGFTASNLFPLNPDKVLKDMPKPPTDLIILKANKVKIGSCPQDAVLQTPVTPVSAKALMSLQDLILKQDAQALNETSKQRL